jgi:3-hydroxy-9,10-secoandrosta-1,3,5(10)-triene-9,17-dione monooxygenase
MIMHTIIAVGGGGMAEQTGLGEAVGELVDAVTTKSVAALRASVAVRALQPVRYGGLALRDDDFVSLICELALRDASAGWLAAMFGAAAYEVAGLPEHTSDEVWSADPKALVATSSRVEGQYADDRRLTGRWGSVVGAEYADWLLLSADDEGIRRVLVPRSAVRVDPVSNPTGLSAAGIGDVTVSELAVDERHVFRNQGDRVAVLAAAGMAAAVVGSADGVWRKHVEQVRARLAASYGGEQVTDEAAAQVARAASDIDAARLQIATSCGLPRDPAAWAFQQAVARARDAADRLLGASRHALDASDPVTSQWKDVHAGCRLAVPLLR